MQENLALKVVLTADGRPLAGTLNVSKKDVQEFAATADSSGVRASAALDKTTHSAKGMSAQLGQASVDVKTLTTAVVGYIGVAQLMGQAANLTTTVASYQDVRTRLQGLTKESGDYAAQEQYLTELAGEHHKSLLTLADSYSRLLTLQNSGLLTNEQSRDILEGLSNAASQLGASNTQLEQTMYGLSQGLSAGILRAEEFNQVVEPLPGLLQELDKAAGLPAGGFRQLVNAGEVTSAMFRDTLTKALESYSGAAERTGNNINAQMADAQNNYLALARALEQPINNSLSAALTASNAAMGFAADNADIIIPLLGTVMVAALSRLTVGVTAATATTIKKQLADKALAAETLRLAKAHELSTATALRNAQAMAAAGLGNGKAAAAAAAHEAAVVRLNAAQITTTASSRALSATLGVFGGPVGLAITAGIVGISYAFAEAAEQAEELKRITAKATANLDAYNAKQNTESALKERIAAEEAAITRLQLAAAEGEKSIQKLSQVMADNPGASGIGQSIEQIWTAIKNTDPEIAKHEQAIAELTQRLEALGGEYVRTGEQSKKQRDAVTRLLSQLEAEHAQLSMNAEALLRYQLAGQGATAEQVDYAVALLRSNAALKDNAEAQKKAAAEAEKSAQAQQQWLQKTINSIDPTRELVAEIERVTEAWKSGELAGLSEEQIDAYISALGKKLDDALEKSASTGAREFSDMTDRVADALQNAIANGDWKDVGHTIGAIMAGEIGAAVSESVAKSTASSLGSVGAGLAGALSGAIVGGALAYLAAAKESGFSESYLSNQASQGTGTVLASINEKSTSITNASELTAKATTELVGINRDMLLALRDLQSGISGAVALIARGSRGIEFGSQGVDVSSSPLSDFAPLFENNMFDWLSGGLMGDLFNSVSDFLGGSSKVTDQGVRIIGGTLSELIDDTMVQAYQEIKSKKYAWSSTKKKTSYSNLDDSVGNQFELVFESIADSVYAGATALGLAGADVEEAINGFVIETQKISLKGLSAEEQQAEIEAVFSTIFDDLAGDVVPFLEDFQKAGEGLGETLARLATYAQVAEQASSRLGFAFDAIDPEQIAAASTALIDAAGGLEDFISGMSGFISAFASDEYQLGLLTDDLTQRFSAVNLTLPDTRDGMWELMQSLDATTDAGREQIATLLELSGAADAYYAALEKQGMLLSNLIGQQSGDALTQYFSELSDYVSAESSVIAADYAERIALLQVQSRIAKELRDYTDKLRLSDLSPYDPSEKLSQASENFAALLVRAQAGDMEAAAALSDAAQSYLENADSYFGRTDAYASIFDDVVNSLDQLGLDLAATSTDDIIEQLNEQMLAEQQQLRDLMQQELDWAVASYDALSSVEQLLQALPGSLGDVLSSMLSLPESNDATRPVRPDGSHRSGLLRVPFDGYVAELHANERVLTAQESADYAAGGNSALMNEIRALREELNALRAERSADAASAARQRDDQKSGIDSVARASRSPVRTV